MSDGLQERIAALEAERDQLRQERDAAQAQHERALEALRRVWPAVVSAPEDYSDIDGHEDSRTEMLKCMRFVLAAPESAAVLERERLRQAVVDAARRVLAVLDTPCVNANPLETHQAHVALTKALAALDRAEGRKL